MKKQEKTVVETPSSAGVTTSSRAGIVLQIVLHCLVLLCLLGGVGCAPTEDEYLGYARRGPSPELRDGFGNTARILRAGPQGANVNYSYTYIEAGHTVTMTWDEIKKEFPGPINARVIQNAKLRGMAE